MGITSAGIGSGLDVNTIVKSLVDAEAEPAKMRFDRKEVNYQSKISAYGTLKGSLSELQASLQSLGNLTNLQTPIATSANTSLFLATADATAAVGSYQVAVKTIAQNHKLISNFALDQNTPIGTGTLNISVGTAAFSVAITANNNTYAQICQTINTASNNTGVTATVMNLDGGSKLVLSSNKTGTDAAISIAVTNDLDGNNTDNLGLSQLAYDPANGVTKMNVLQTAVNAQILIDGQTVTSQTNTITNAIAGVTLTAIAQSPVDTTNDLTIANNPGNVQTIVGNFVTTYNNLMKSIQQLTAFDPDNNVRGPLLSDSTTRVIKRQIQTDILTTVPTLSGKQIHGLTDIGLSLDKAGMLTLDKTKLTSTLNQNFDDVCTMLAESDDGIANVLSDTIAEYTNYEGLLTSQIDEFEEGIHAINDDRMKLQTHLQSYEARLRKQFGALDEIMSKYSALGNYLKGQFSSLPGFSDRSK